MKKNIFLSALLCAFMFSETSFCQEKKDEKSTAESIKEITPELVKGEKDVGAAISPLKKFQAAPFTGVLLSPLSIATLVSEIEHKAAEIEIEVNKVRSEDAAKLEYEKSILQNRCDADKQILKLNVDNKLEQIKLLDETLKAEMNSRPNPVLWTFIGIAIGTVVTTSTAVIITNVATN